MIFSYIKIEAFKSTSADDKERCMGTTFHIESELDNYMNIYTEIQQSAGRLFSDILSPRGSIQDKL